MLPCVYVLEADDGDRLRLEVEVEAEEMLDDGGDIICHVGSPGAVLCVMLDTVVSVGESRTSADWSGRKWCCSCWCRCEVWMGCGILERESDLERARGCCSRRGDLDMFSGAGFGTLSKFCRGCDSSRPWSVCSERCVERLLDRDRPRYP